MQPRLLSLVHDCFMTEVNALKPGNVSRYADGHGMCYQDFVRSAELVTPVLCDPGLGIGQRILEGVRVTQRGVGCNTNLGMLLLLAPVLKLYEQNPSLADFRALIQALIKAIDLMQSKDIFTAINLAHPGGLGEVEEYNVKGNPEVRIYTAMEAAGEDDLIALQYVNGYREITDIGVKCLCRYDNRWKSVEWSSVACYLTYMMRFPDSHIVRKHGHDVAEQVRRGALPILKQLDNYHNPERAVDMLMGFDKELKDAHINPGTCADLTVASLLLYRLGFE